MVLCANNTDLPEEMWEVSREQFRLFAEENKLAIFECSASRGIGVDEVSPYSLSQRLIPFQPFLAISQLILKNNRSNLTEIKEADRGVVVFNVPPWKSRAAKAFDANLQSWRETLDQRMHEFLSPSEVPIKSKPSFWSRLWDRNTEDTRTKPPESQLAVPPQRPRDVRDERRLFHPSLTVLSRRVRIFFKGLCESVQRRKTTIIFP
jgi:hypothetical protein